MNTLLRILHFPFACHHSQLSRVFTIRKRTYQVCLTCGEEFEYSWARMQPGAPIATDNVRVQRNSVRHPEVAVI